LEEEGVGGRKRGEKEKKREKGKEGMNEKRKENCFYRAFLLYDHVCVGVWDTTHPPAIRLLIWI